MSTVNIIHEVTATPDSFRKILLEHSGLHAIKVIGHVLYSKNWMEIVNSFHQHYVNEPVQTMKVLTAQSTLDYLDSGVTGTYSIRMNNTIFIMTITE